MKNQVLQTYKIKLDKQLSTTWEEIIRNLKKDVFDSLSTSQLQRIYRKAFAFVAGGGKRLRPLLILLVMKVFGAKINNSLVLSSALAPEFVHASTLGVDDWMDESDKRRNEPSLHMRCLRVGNGHNKESRYFRKNNMREAVAEATLLSNIILGEGFLLLAKSKLQGSGLALVDLVKTYTLINAGQILDNRPINNLNAYLQMIELKTSLLFACCARMGAYLAEQSQQVVEHVGKAFQYVGMVFQITDDILDYQKEKGRDVGTDLKNGKITILSILFFQKEKNPKRKTEFMSYFGKPSLTEKEVDRAIQLLRKSGVIDEAKKVRDKFHQKSLRLISQLPVSAQSKKLLGDFATFWTF